MRTPNLPEAMHKTVLFTLAFCLFAFAFSGAVHAGTAHDFDSGGLHKVTSATIEVPGAAALPSSVTLKLRTMRAMEGGAECTAGAPASFACYAQPAVDIYGGFNVHGTLPLVLKSAALGSFDGLIDYGGASGFSWSEGAAGAEVMLTITDPTLCAAYVGTTAQIPLNFSAGYSATWTGGNGTSFVSSAFGWSGTVTYN